MSLEGEVGPVRKELLLDLRTLGLPIGNVEGMTLGSCPWTWCN
jgi:hypothetical protein